MKKNNPNPLRYLSKNNIILMVEKDPVGMVPQLDEHLRDDIEVMLPAIRKLGKLIEFASPRLKADKSLALLAIHDHYVNFKLIAPQLKEDRAFIVEVIKSNPYCLRIVAPPFQQDKEIVLLAVNNSFMAFNGASDALRDDKEFIKTLIEKEPCILHHCSPRIKADKEVVLLATQRRASAFSYACEELQLLCGVMDPVEFLTKAIMQEKLANKLPLEPHNRKSKPKI